MHPFVSNCIRSPVATGIQLRPCGGLEIVAGGQLTTIFYLFFIAEEDLNGILGGPGCDGIPLHIDHVRVLHEPRDVLRSVETLTVTPAANTRDSKGVRDQSSVILAANRLGTPPGSLSRKGLGSYKA